MTDAELQRVVDRVMAALPKNLPVPHPTVIGGPHDIPRVQRKSGVQTFRHGAVICLPMLDLVYLFRASIERAYGNDLEAMELAIRKTLVEIVAPGFGPVA